MTLAEVARQLNTSTMTVYRRLKRAGINIEELRDDKSGELTAAGVSAIASLFDAPGATEAEQELERVITGKAERGVTGATAAQMPTDAVAAAVKVAELTAQVDGLRALVSALEGERDELRRQLDAVTAALHAEQQDRASERRLLTGSTSGDDGRQRRGFFDFLRRKT